jgi:hypothetical protein
MEDSHAGTDDGIARSSRWQPSCAGPGLVTTQCIAHVAMVLTNMCQLAQQVNKTPQFISKNVVYQ